MKKLLLFIVLMLCVALTGLVACAEVHEHSLKKHDAVSVACEADGNKEYYSCDCGKYFEDEEATKEIEKDSWIITKTGHAFSDYVYNDDAVCEEDGTKTATCENSCGKTDTIMAEDTALEHSFTNYIYNDDATYEGDGTKTATCDNGCGKKDTITASGTKLEQEVDEEEDFASFFDFDNVTIVAGSIVSVGSSNVRTESIKTYISNGKWLEKEIGFDDDVNPIEIITYFDGENVYKDGEPSDSAPICKNESVCMIFAQNKSGFNKIDETMYYAEKVTFYGQSIYGQSMFEKVTVKIFNGKVSRIEMPQYIEGVGDYLVFYEFTNVGTTVIDYSI